MQCQSYLPLYYAHNDLNMDANGSTKPLYIGHAKPQIRDFNQKIMNYTVPEGFHLGYGKEFLRQTMLQQEVIFKSQVQELHRLYKRQRELVDEMKRSNYYPKKSVPFRSDQKAACSKPFDCLDFSHPSAQIPWATSFKGESAISASHISVNDLDLSLSNNSTTARRKPLNLHLPADEYIKSEEKESCSNNYEVSGLSFLSTHASKKASSTTVSSSMIDLAKFPGSENMWTEFSSGCPYKKKLKMCKNNMETENAWKRWQPCSDEVKNRSSLYSESLRRSAEASKVHQSASLFTTNDGWIKNVRSDRDIKIPGGIDWMLDLNTPVKVGSSEWNPGVLPMRSSGADVLDHSSGCEEEKSLQISCSESNVKASSASSGFLFQIYKSDLAPSKENGTSKGATRVNSIDLNCTGAASCEETSNTDNQRHKKGSMLFDINLPCHLTTDRVQVEDDNEHSNPIKLGSADLEASITPEKESPRPREHSADNKTETSLVEISAREDAELMKAAVDVLLSISSCEPQQKSTGNELLIWFAGLVSSTEQASTTRIDYFEAMTLKLTDTSDEDYLPNTTTIHTDKAMCDTESSRGSRPRKRVRRKNFQREILPSLSSLSRCEASEDILMIERLMEAAGTPLQIGVRKRKVKRKQKNEDSGTSWESRTCLLALPCVGIRAIDLKDKGCVRWENIARRPRGKRCRNTCPSTSLSQEGWMKKWGGIKA